MIPVRRFDAIVVGAGRRRHARGARAGAGQPQGRGAVQSVPDALAYRRRPGRHRRAARQHHRGQLALAHVRHRQGLRLPRRPGRDRVHVPARDRGRGRARAHGHAVRPHRERRDLPAAFRRPYAELRQPQDGDARLRRRRPHRARHAAHALPAERALEQPVPRRVDGARSHHRPAGRRLRRRHRRWKWRPGELFLLQAKATLLATGGAGRIYWATTNAFINTGDGLGMVARAGCRSRTWSSGSSIPPASPAPGC